jgi:hypothetical protein
MKINANLTTQTDELTGSTMSPAKLEAYYFNLVTAILFTVFALIGNCLVIFVLTKPKFLEVPLFRYLIVATIVETISVSFIWASGFPNVFGINSYDINCKMYVYLSILALQIGPWINVLSSIDRYLSVKHPTKFHFRKQFKFQAYFVVIICGSLILINIPYFVYSKVSGNICYIDLLAGLYLTIFLNGNMHCILPSICMVTMNGMTIYQLIVYRKKHNKTNFYKEVQFAKVLFSSNLVFVILNLPFTIYIVVQLILGVNFFVTFGYRVVVVLQKFDYSCIFIVYYFSNEHFRQEVQSILGFKNRVTPIRETKIQFTSQVNTNRNINNHLESSNFEDTLQIQIIII